MYLVTGNPAKTAVLLSRNPRFALAMDFVTERMQYAGDITGYGKVPPPEYAPSGGYGTPLRELASRALLAAAVTLLPPLLSPVCFSLGRRTSFCCRS